jgi:serine/threonine protein kinase
LAIDSQRSFEIVEIPGAGATATVCVARDDTGQMVALKVLREDFAADRDVLTRTRDEARMLHRLNHPNIVRVDGLLSRGGRPVVVMEWVEGCSLREVLARTRAALPTAIAVEAVREIANALEAAFNCPSAKTNEPMRIVHRDVKPSHILMSVDGRVKLTDFGIAKGVFDDREAVSLYMVHGSWGYMSPERLNEEPDTPAVDVYALGLTLFELVTGKPMVMSRHPDKHDRGMRKQLEFFQAEGGDQEHVDALRALVERMCRFEPEERPTPTEVARELATWLETAGLDPDLPAYAREGIVPLRADCVRQPPQEHPAWPEVQFLHNHAPAPSPEADDEATVVDTIPPPPPRKDKKALDAWLREQVADPDWVRNLDELKVEVRGRKDWSLIPFLAVIDGALLPWWDFWSSKVRTDQVVAALELLQERPEPKVLDRARQLAKSGSPRVVEAAKRVLQAGEHEDGR